MWKLISELQKVAAATIEKRLVMAVKKHESVYQNTAVGSKEISLIVERMVKFRSPGVVSSCVCCLSALSPVCMNLVSMCK